MLVQLRRSMSAMGRPGSAGTQNGWWPVDSHVIAFMAQS
jgi:hypothetical protein